MIYKRFVLLIVFALTSCAPTGPQLLGKYFDSGSPEHNSGPTQRVGVDCPEGHHATGGGGLLSIPGGESFSVLDEVQLSCSPTRRGSVFSPDPGGLPEAWSCFARETTTGTDGMWGIRTSVVCQETSPSP